MSERLYDVEAIASRILTQGSYARVSQDELRAMAEWIALQLDAMRRINNRTLGIDGGESTPTPDPSPQGGGEPTPPAMSALQTLFKNEEASDG